MLKYFCHVVIASVFVLATTLAEARVFSFQDNWVAPYLRGTGGMSNIARDAYRNTSGTLTDFGNASVDYNFTAEFGFSFVFSDQFLLRLGVEGVKTQTIAATGNATGTTTNHMNIDSRISGMQPVANAEFSFPVKDNKRYFIFVGAGWGDFKVANEYAITTDGQTDYGSVPSYKEVWQGDAISYQLGAGFEMHALDNVTLSVEAGYRMMNISDWTYADTLQVIRGGAATNIAKGAKVTNNSGTAIELDLSGAFIGFMFRFYIPPLN